MGFNSGFKRLTSYCNVYGVSEIWTIRKRARERLTSVQMEFLQTNRELHPFRLQKECKSFGRVQRRTSWMALRRYKSDWLRHVTSMNNSRMPKIMVNCRPNGRRRIGRLLKRLLDEAETGLSMPTSGRKTMTMVMVKMVTVYGP